MSYQPSATTQLLQGKDDDYALHPASRQQGWDRDWFLFAETQAQMFKQRTECLVLA
jgi:hypothetical protein